MNAVMTTPSCVTMHPGPRIADLPGAAYPQAKDLPCTAIDPFDDVRMYNVLSTGAVMEETKKSEAAASVMASRSSGTPSTVADVSYVSYEGEQQLGAIMTLVDRDLSEPYSIFTYRYFLNGWPDLCFLAYVNEGLVGVIIGKADSESGGPLRGYIAMLAVDSEHRRKGIGRELVSRAVRQMEETGCDEVMLETELTNSGALRLYEGLGFAREERLLKYYLNGGDAFRLKLWLRREKEMLALERELQEQLEVERQLQEQTVVAVGGLEDDVRLAANGLQGFSLSDDGVARGGGGIGASVEVGWGEDSERPASLSSRAAHSQREGVAITAGR